MYSRGIPGPLFFFFFLADLRCGLEPGNVNYLHDKKPLSSSFLSLTKGPGKGQPNKSDNV
jgi:hypothetical protein